MGAGYLKVQTRTGEGALPVEGAKVVVFYPDGRMIIRTATDKNGDTEALRIHAPDKRYTLDPDYRGSVYSAVNVVIRKIGFFTYHVQNVQIFDTITTILPQNLEPLTGEEGRAAHKHIVIPPPGLLSDTERQNTPPPPAVQAVCCAGNGFSQPVRAAAGVCPPEYITVHLGAPGDAAARNVKVKFADYIKNAASCELYPTWPESAVEANINAIATFAFNRVYTRWYTGRGYAFDITDSPAHDIRCCPNGPVFDSICRAADGVSGIYARRKGSDAPFLTQFSSGADEACRGLSQWGAVSLANQGRTPLEILRFYYPSDLELVRGGGAPDPDIAEACPGCRMTQNSGKAAFVNPPFIDVSPVQKNALRSAPLNPYAESGAFSARYRGIPLKTGSAGVDVRLMQTCLSILRAAYPALPVTDADGAFGLDTQNAVTGFQKLFGLIPDGTIDINTWNAIIDQTNKTI